MALSITPSEMQVRTALKAFLVSVLPSGVEVLLGQQNRIPEPQATAYAVIWPLRHRRLATNLHSFQDCFFDGQIAGVAMAVGTVTGLPLAIGRQVFGPGVTPGTVITGGSGNAWTVAPAQTVADGILSAGAATFLMQTHLTYQIDSHGAPPAPNNPVSGPDATDIARTITTMFRDAYATELFAATGFPIAPISVDEGQEVPWTNAEEQYEFRWVQEARLQANFMVSGVPLEFADSAHFVGIPVDLVPSPAPPGGAFILDQSLLDGPNVLG